MPRKITIKDFIWREMGFGMKHSRRHFDNGYFLDVLRYEYNLPLGYVVHLGKGQELLFPFEYPVGWDFKFLMKNEIDVQMIINEVKHLKNV